MNADRPAPPAVVQARVKARWNAALELIRATDAIRELAKLGRPTGEEKRRHDEAERVWDRLNGGGPR